ncbi:hypothetical protein [Mesorhizobium sp. L103C105A0]
MPLEAFVAFKSAFAKGRYFNNHLRNQLCIPARPRKGCRLVGD